ncbi:nucleotidyltransferase domain-containing protein, partial [Candidatus Poribacteria bacterium]|nr:nucleotidyltransferase domain-containing protein [Candidatus Poribacteria bacterium]
MDQRIEHARQIAACFATDERVSAVILGGSVARGEARDDSDIDVGVFWSELPSSDDVRALDALAGLTVHRTVSNTDRFEHAIVRQFGDIRICSLALSGADTLVVDVEDQSVSGTDVLISQVLDDLVTSLDHQELISVIQGGIALHGEPLVDAWRNALTPYPEGLRRKTVEEQMLGTRGVAARMRRQTDHLARGDWLWLLDERI